MFNIFGIHLAPIIINHLSILSIEESVKKERHVCTSKNPSTKCHRILQPLGPVPGIRPVPLNRADPGGHAGYPAAARASDEHFLRILGYL